MQLTSHGKMPGFGRLLPYKLFLVMKLTAILLTITCLQLSANSFSQSISLSGKNLPLEKVLTAIEKQSGYFFFYKYNELKSAKPVSIDLDNVSVAQALEQSFKGQPFKYVIEERTIIVTKKNEKEPVKITPLITVRGKVTDDKGEPLPGATIRVKGSNQATVSDINGVFNIANVEDNAVLVITYTGFAQQEISVNGRAEISISLKEDLQALSEVVVVGYGTQKKVNLTGSVAQINGEQLRDRPVTNMSTALQGAIPNLNITMSGGAPGTMGSLNVRGVTSINGNSSVSNGPLVLIDGIPGTLDRLSPEEVQTITVLKDAGSAAIYGARGAFGVVLITTKSGSGKPVIRYNNSFGFNTPTVSTDFITTGYDWMKLNDAALAHVGGYSGYSEKDYEELLARRNDKTEDPSRPWVTIQNRNGQDQYVYYGNYDWYDFMFTKWQPMQNHNLNVSGSNEKVSYMINGNMKNMDGIMRIHTDKYSSYNLRTKVGAQLKPWLKLSNNINFYNSNYKYYGRRDGGNANFTNINVHASPAYAPINPDGTATYITGLNQYDIGDGIFAMLQSGTTKGTNRKYELTTITEATISPIKDLNITANYSYNMFTDPSFYRQAPATYSLYPGKVEVATKYNTDLLTEEQQFNQVHVINVFGEYSKSLNNVHNFKVLAGFNQELNLAKKITAAKQNVSSLELNDLNLATGDPTVAGGSGEYALRGYFYRFNYNYKDKYLFESNGRYDGTSRFPNGRRFGFFPSASLGWVASGEDFFRPLSSVVSNLKLRASVGALGNQQINNDVFDARYPYVLAMRSGTAAYMLDGIRANYYRAPSAVSADLTWEDIVSYNGGIDIGLFNNRLDISFDRYVRNTSNMLDTGTPLPNVFGTDVPLVNVASLRTQGFELSVNWNSRFNLAGKPFKYNIGVNLSDNHSVVTKVDKSSDFTYGLYVGKELGEIWGYITDGYFKTDAEAKTYPVDQSFLNKVRRDNNVPLRAGDLRWVDLDGDGKISSGTTNTIYDPGDQKVIGNSTPRYAFSVNLGASWSNFDFSAFIQGIGKREWYPGNNADRFWGPYSRPYFSFLPRDFESKVWTPENPDAYFPTLMAYVALNANNELRATNNRYLQDLAYVRLKNLVIGYSLPTRFTKKFKIERLRAFVSGENMFTLTKLDTKYIDPEQAMANADGRVYPFSKTYSFGFDVSF
ncbi:TonB-dependent receptor [Arcticibacter tournemirensis]|uniref:SusC/RagA family TonB-linked outer membrane protein n=1 Tax=Arcticibacter tournemirensis TaxID=699437 RepID=A0A4Q0M6U7_9SPHI|nr:TonB-dependent receptor [Arcticibacter tournemirensis]RXF68790.1 SusC/RagA family TonB-linked outer membrane protein [Arcticibacter tournemirensis]